MALYGTNSSWQQTMIRIRNPKDSLGFYCDLLGMTLVFQIDFPQYKFSLYFLQTLPKGSKYEFDPKSEEAKAYLFNTNGVTLELTHNYGTESDPDFKYHPGNQTNDGFGHIAFSCEDVYLQSANLEKAGCNFKKKPDEGRMKGLAFVYDPDGYWVELVKRDVASSIAPTFSLAQTMLRVKDAKKSIAFYEKLGMTLVASSQFSDFSLYFMATLHDPKMKQAILNGDGNIKKDLYNNNIPVLELTHNHGTENNVEFKHFNGNEADRRGFGHIGFLVDDVYKITEEMLKDGVEFQKLPDAGNMKGLAFAKDPDGYWVEIIKRGDSI